MAEVNLRIGTEYENGELIYMNATGSRAVFICGKRGSGKSYTLGVIIEELFNQEQGEGNDYHCRPDGDLPHDGSAERNTSG